jgi:hypothetical protein
MYKKSVTKPKQYNNGNGFPVYINGNGTITKDGVAVYSIDSVGINDPLPASTYNEETMLFRMSARSAWGKWAWSLLNYSISLNGNLPNTEQVKSRLQKNAIELGEILSPYYGLTVANVFSTALLSIGNVGVEYVEAAKDGRDTAQIEAKWDALIDDLSSILFTLNPKNWPKELLDDIFTNLTYAWVDQLKARAASDIVADEIAIDYINKLVITGLGKGSSNMYKSLADIFSRGIIAQFPNMFEVD